MYVKVQTTRSFLYSLALSTNPTPKDSMGIFLHSSRSAVDVALECV